MDMDYLSFRVGCALMAYGWGGPLAAGIYLMAIGILCAVMADREAAAKAKEDQ